MLHLEDTFPLPIQVDQRTDPCQWIPDLSDETGKASLLWKAVTNLVMATGRSAGSRFGDYALPYQERIIRAIAGPSAPETQLFWVSEIYFEAAKKSGKTQFFSLLMLAISVIFPQRDARYYLVAGSADQARFMYTAISSAIQADDRLSAIATIRDYRRDIIFPKTGALISVVALTDKQLVGTIATGVYVDEVHVVTKDRRALQLIRQLTASFAVTGGFALYSTTKPLPSEPSSGLMASLRNRARSILSGDHDAAPESLLPIVFEPVPGQDLDDSKYWFRSQPSLGHTVTLDWLIRQHRLAQVDPDPAVLDDFRAQLLNAHVDSSASGIDGWPPARQWSRWSVRGMTVDDILVRADPIIIAIDAGGQTDLSSLVILGRIDGVSYAWSQAWLTQDGYERWMKNQPLYDEAIQCGELVVTSSPGEDLEQMFSIIERASPRLVAVDPYGLADLVVRCEARGQEVLGIAQGYKISPHLEALERAYFADEVRHGDRPLLRFCVQNMRIADRGGAKAIIKPSNYADSPEKIDLGVALVMAWAGMRESQEAMSVYEDASRELVM